MPPRDMWLKRNHNLRRKDSTYGSMYNRFAFLGNDDIDLDLKLSQGHRIHRATDIGQEWLRKQAALEYIREKLATLRQPIALGVKD